MDERGFTLIELLVVISIVGALVIAMGLSFEGWMGNYRVESQAKTMHIDLMNVRGRAMQRNVDHFVVINANNYQIFEDTNGNGSHDAGDAPIPGFSAPKQLQYASLGWTGTVGFDGRGFSNQNKTIHFDIGDNTPDYDCIVLFTTRINLGKWDSGGGKCDAK